MNIVRELLRIFQGISYDDLLEQFKTLKLQYDRSEQTVSTLSDDNKLLLDKLKYVQSKKLDEINVLEQKLKVLNSTLESNESIRKELTSQNILLSDKIESQLSEKKELSSKLSVLKLSEASLKKSLSQYEGKLKESQELLSQSSQQIEKYQEEKRVDRSLVEKLTNENSQIQDELNLKRNEYSDLREELERVSGSNKTLEQSLASLQNILNNQKQQISDFSTQRKNMENEKLTLLSESAEIQQANSDLVEQNLLLSSQIKKLSDKIQSQEILVSELNKSCQSFQEQIESLNDEKSNIQKDYENVLKEQKEIEPYLYLVENKRKEERAAQELNDSKNKLDIAVNTAKELVTSLTHQELVDELNGIISVSQKLLEQSDLTLEDVSNHISQISNKTAEIRDMENKLLDAEQLQKLQASRDLAEAKDNLRDLLSEVDNCCSTILFDEITNELKTCIPLINECLNHDKSSLDEIHDTIQQCQEKIDFARKQNEILEEKAQSKVLVNEIRDKLSLKLSDIQKFLTELFHVIDTSIFDGRVAMIKNVLDDENTSLDEFKFEYSQAEQIFSELKAEKEMANHNVKRSILEIWDKKEGVPIYADEFFKRPEGELIRWRRIFEESILNGEHRFICPYCRQDVKISGRKFYRGEVCYFSHLHDSDFCEIKTTTGLSKEQIEARKYGLVAESERHIRLKNQIFNALNSLESQKKGISDTVLEKRIDSDIPYLNWRKPDVMTNFNGKKVVFELQLSTTFISVVVQRDIFYRLNGYFIIWVFNFDENQKYVDLTNLMCKDIYYANKRNIFIFDEEAQEASVEKGELMLKCNWLDVDATWHFSPTKENGDGILVSLDDLQYDEESAKPYYYDAETPYLELHPEVKERIQKEEKSKKEMIDQLFLRQEREKEMNIIRKENALKKMLEKDESVVPFQDGGKWGFKYDDVILVPAQFSSYLVLDKNGLFQVYYNRHYGLISKYGNPLFECDYLKFHYLRDNIIVAESSTGFYVSDNLKICNRHLHDVIELNVLSDNIMRFTLNWKDLDCYIINDSVFFFKNDRGYMIIARKTGELLVDEEYSRFHFSRDYLSIWLQKKESGKWVLAELDGTPIYPKEYQSYVNYQLIEVASNEEGTDIFNDKGELLITTPYASVEPFKETDLYLVTKDNKCGLINQNFEEVLPTVYDKLMFFNFRIKAQQNNLWGLFSLSGKQLSDIIYEDISLPYGCSYFHLNRYSKVKKEEKYGVLANDGEIILDCIYQAIDFIDNDGNIVCQTDEGYYLYSAQTKNLYKDKLFSSIELINKGSFLVSEKDQKGIIDTEANVLVPLIYTDLKMATALPENYYHQMKNDDMFIAYHENKACVWLVSAKTMIVPLDFDDVIWWHDQYFRVKENNLWGIYQTGVGLVVRPIYEKICDFKEGEDTPVVKNSMESGHIDENGKETYSKILSLDEGYIAKLFFSKWAIFDEHDKEIIPFDYYTAINYLGHDLFKVMKDGLCGVKNRVNEYVYPLKYRDILGGPNCDFLIMKVIVEKREREYTYGHSYHMVNREYNYFKLINIDGTQNLLPTKCCSLFTNMSFVCNRQMVMMDGHLLSLGNMAFTDQVYSECKTLENSTFYLVKMQFGSDWGLLNKTLKQIVPCEYHDIQLLGNYLIQASKQKKIFSFYRKNYVFSYDLYQLDGALCEVGTVDSVGNIIEGKIRVVKNNAETWIDEKGEFDLSVRKELVPGVFAYKIFNHVVVKDKDNNVLLPLSKEIDDVQVLKKECYLFKKDNKYGMIKQDWTVVLPCNYTSISEWSDNILLVSIVETYHSIFQLVYLDGTLVSDQIYESIDKLCEGKAKAKRNNLIGYLDEYGKEIYTSERDLYKGEFIVREKFGLCGVYSKKGIEILKEEWEEISEFGNHWLLGRKKGCNSFVGSYLMDLDGKSLLPEPFDSIEMLENGCLRLKKGMYYALFDAVCNELIPFSKKCTTIKIHSEDLYVVEISHAYYEPVYQYLVSADGTFLTHRGYRTIETFNGDLAQVTLNSYQKGYINKKGEEIDEDIDSRGEWHIMKSFGYFKVKRANETIYERLNQSFFVSDKVIALKSEKSSYYNLFNILKNEQLQNIYKEVEMCKEGKANVTNQFNLHGCIDEQGYEIYDEVTDLENEYESKLKFERYDVYHEGIRILSNLLSVERWTEELLCVQNTEKLFLLYDTNQKQYLNCKFTKVGKLTNGEASVIIDGKHGKIDARGNLVPDKICKLDNSISKVHVLDRWQLFKTESKEVIFSSYCLEMGSCKGKIITFFNRSYKIWTESVEYQIPVEGHYKETLSKFVKYVVGGHYVYVNKRSFNLVESELVEYINGHPKLYLIISHVNERKSKVFARPYVAIVPQKNEPFNIDKVYNGTVTKIVLYGLRIKLEDGRNTLIHISRLSELNKDINDFYKGQSISLKWIGHNASYNNEIWDIQSEETVLRETKSIEE